MTAIIDGYCTLGTERETRLRPDELLRLMDQAGIGRAVIAPEDRQIAVDNARGNDFVLQASSRSGGRFIPACAVNPWFGRGGCDELQRAAAAGAKMLVLAPALQGFCLGDEVADELLQTAGRLRVPVYVHTGPHSSSAPTQLVLLATRHLATSFILGHCGSTDFAHDMPAVLKAAPDNLWFEVSLARPWSVAAYDAILNRPALIFGSSAPRGDPAYELEQLSHYLPVAEHPGFYGANLAKLLGEAA
jgi:predicted TIM-barrel fold metal-dependent hydrolase